MKNQDIIKKADLALADLSADGGLLLPEQSDRFIQVMVDSPTILNSARVVKMSGPQRNINKIGFGSRILRPAVSGSALIAGDRAKPTTSQVQLNTKEVIAEINLPYDVIEDNIERGSIGGTLQQGAGGLHDTILTLIAERAALDLEELILLGDTASGDAYLALLDGYLKQATAHVVNGGAATISKALFKAGVKAMPDKYLRNRSALSHFISVDNETEYRDTYANRNTQLGDDQLQGNNKIFTFGSEVRAVPLMPAAKGLFTDPMNLIFGVQRKINIEFDRDIRARTFVIVLTARIDAQIEETDAVVSYTNIG